MTPLHARTFVAECYAPSIDKAAVEAAGARIQAVLGAVPQRPAPVSYTGAMLMPEDEVVFHVFVAGDARDIDEVCRAAGLEVARVVESVTIAGIPSGEGRPR